MPHSSSLRHGSPTASATELEDENVTLVRGQDLSDIFERLRDEDQLAANSGTVDQWSLISDVDAGSCPNPDHDSREIDHKSSQPPRHGSTMSTFSSRT